MTSLDEAAVVTVLAHHVRWLQDCERATNARAVWIFGLCSRLAKPLSAEAKRVLQRLGEEAARLRAAPPDANTLHIAPSNIMITVAAYFLE